MKGFDHVINSPLVKRRDNAVAIRYVPKLLKELWLVPILLIRTGDYQMIILVIFDLSIYSLLAHSFDLVTFEYTPKFTLTLTLLSTSTLNPFLIYFDYILKTLRNPKKP